MFDKAILKSIPTNILVADTQTLVRRASADYASTI